MQPQQISVIEPWGDVGVYDVRPDLTTADIDKVFTFQDSESKGIYRTEPRKVALEQLGITQTKTAAQNDKAWSAAVALGIDHETLLFKKGFYPVGELYGLGLTIRLEGLGLKVSGFSVPAGCVGGYFTCNRQKNYGGLSGGGFSIRAQDMVQNDGILLPGEEEPDFTDNPNGRMIFYAERKKFHGLFLEVVSNLADFGVYGFSGHQIKLQGFIERDGTNVSNSTLRRFEASAGNRYRPDGSYQPGYGGCGVYINGLDANNILLDCPNVNNNPQAGLLDFSGVGVAVRTPHGSENGWGHYHTVSASGATKYDNPYLEGGSPPSTCPPRSTVDGGTRGSPFEGGGNFEGETMHGRLHSGAFTLSKPRGLSFGNKRVNEHADLVNVSSYANENIHWGIRREGSADRAGALEILGRGAQATTYVSAAGDRPITEITIGLNNPLLNGCYLYASKKWPVFGDVPYMLRPGDEIQNVDTSGTAVPSKWAVRQGGYLLPTPYLEDLRASQTNTAAGGVYNYTLQLSAATSVLEPGMFVEIGGKTAAIAPWSVIGDYTRFTYEISDRPFTNDLKSYPNGVPVLLATGNPVPGTKDLRFKQSADDPTVLEANQSLQYLAPDTELQLRYDGNPGPYNIIFKDFSYDKTRLNFYEAMPLGTNLRIAYATAQLRPLSEGMGPLAQRPTVAQMLARPDHIGWPYYATDGPAGGKLTRWDGAAFS